MPTPSWDLSSRTVRFGAFTPGDTVVGGSDLLTPGALMAVAGLAQARQATVGEVIAGLGLSGLTAGALLFASGAATVDKLALGTAGRLMVAGASAPAWSDSGLSYASGVLAVAGSVPATPTSGQVLIGGGAVKAGGAISGASFTATGGVAAAATIYKSATFGLAVQGATGSSYDFGFLKPDGSAFLWYVPTGTADVVIPGGSLVVGTTALAAAERARFTGGTAPGTPGGTDVLIGAGQIKAGGTISGASLTASGLTPTYIPYATTGGLLTNDSGFTRVSFSGGLYTSMATTVTGTGTGYGMRLSLTSNPSGANNGTIQGAEFTAQSESTNANNFTSSTWGIAGFIASGQHYGSGTAASVIGAGFGPVARPGCGAVAFMAGFKTLLQNLHTTQPVTLGVGAYISAPTSSGGNYVTYKGIEIVGTSLGTTNCIGIDIGAMTGTGAYAIRTSTGPVLFGDAVTVPNGTAAAPGVRTTTYAHGLYSASSTLAGISAAGVSAALFGAPNGTIGGQIWLAASATEPGCVFLNAGNTSSMILAPGAATTAGGQTRLYGSTHASKPSYVEFTRGTTVSAYFDNSGKLTINGTTDGILTVNGKIAAKAAVPGSFADLAAVQSYLASILT